MRRLALVAELPILLLVCACSRLGSPVFGSDAGAPTTLADAGSLHRELALSLRALLPDGGLAPIELQPHPRPVIDPTRKLELSTSVALRNHRIRIFDEADRVMISDDQGSDEGTEYQITFHEPLKPGHRYTLVLDAQTGSSFTDERGNAQAERRLEFQVSGEKEKAPARKSSAKKRRRH